MGFKSMKHDYTSKNMPPAQWRDRAATILDAPTNLTAEEFSLTQIDLAWVSHSGGTEDGFKIERSIDGGDFTQIDTVGTGVVVYSDTTVFAGSTYTYRVRAYKSATNSNYSNEASVTLWDEIPAPSALQIDWVGTNEIDISWSFNNPNIVAYQGFKIERKEGVSGPWVEVYTDCSTYHFYYDGWSGFDYLSRYWDTTPILKDLTQYSYRVRAFNGTHYSDYSNVVTDTTLFAAPENLGVVKSSSNSVDLIWLDKSQIEDGYSIERKTGIGGSWGEIATVGANATTYHDDNSGGGLDLEGTTYYYRVRAYKGVTYSDYTNEANTAPTQSISAPTLGDPPDYVDRHEVDISWTSVSGVDGYRVEHKEGTGPWVDLGNYQPNPLHTWFYDGYNGPDGSDYWYGAPLKDDTTYSYRVRAYKGSNYSAYSNVVVTKTLIAPPRAIHAYGLSTTSIRVTWENKSVAANGYKIYLDDGTYIDVINSASTLSYDVTGLLAGKVYGFKLRTRTASDGDSNFSNIVYGATLINVIPDIVVNPPDDNVPSEITGTFPPYNDPTPPTITVVSRPPDGGWTITTQPIPPVIQTGILHARGGGGTDGVSGDVESRIRPTWGRTGQPPIFGDGSLGGVTDVYSVTPWYVRPAFFAPRITSKSFTNWPRTVTINFAYDYDVSKIDGFEVERYEFDPELYPPNVHPYSLTTMKTWTWTQIGTPAAAASVSFVDSTVKDTWYSYYRVRAYKGVAKGVWSVYTANTHIVPTYYDWILVPLSPIINMTGAGGPSGLTLSWTNHSVHNTRAQWDYMYVETDMVGFDITGQTLESFSFTYTSGTYIRMRPAWYHPFAGDYQAETWSNTYTV